jgi:hypothetical protein
MLLSSIPPLPCPFCGGLAIGRTDGQREDRPFYVRCSHAGCPGHNTTQSYAAPEEAMLRWNRRIQPAPRPADILGDVTAFATKDLIRGEMVVFCLDRTGVLTSDKMEFGIHSRPLMLKPKASHEPPHADPPMGQPELGELFR